MSDTALPSGGPPAIETPAARGRSLLSLALMRLRRNRPAMVGFVVLAAVALFSFLGPLLVDHRYDEVFPSYVNIAPSLEPLPRADEIEAAAQSVVARARVTMTSFAVDGGTFTAELTAEAPIDPRVVRYFDRANEFAGAEVTATADDGRRITVEGDVHREFFPFGTDANGRDLMVRVMLGGQISLAVGVLASLVALIVGVGYGATSGYLGGRIDNVMMRFVEILYSLPFVFLVVVLVVFFGRSFVLIFIVIGAVEWLEMSRIVRGQTLSLKRREFVAAAEALGLTTPQIIRRHIIPNTVGPVIVYATIVVPKVMLLESFLSFLGLGVQAPLTSWGALISEGANKMQSTPWLLVMPSLFFVATLFSLNFIGDGLRDALDPRDR